jgi:hypothetical protein
MGYVSPGGLCRNPNNADVEAARQSHMCAGLDFRTFRQDTSFRRDGFSPN